MSVSLILAGLWVVAATGCAFMPDHCHRPASWVLVVAGIPLLGYVTWESGPVPGLLALVVGVLVLRWPLFSLARWMRRHRRRP